MVSHRCKMAVVQELKKLGLRYNTVDLGIVDLQDDLTKEQRNALKQALFSTELELIEDKKDIMVEQIRNAVVEVIHDLENKIEVPFSTFLSNKLKLNYTYLSNLFTKSEGVTIAQFIIKNKIERVKELIQYNELSFSEIAFELHYSSIAHLSNQFKKITGNTLTFYKTHGLKREINIENL